MTTTLKTRQTFALSPSWRAVVTVDGFYGGPLDMHGRHRCTVAFMRDVPGVGWDGVGRQFVKSGVMRRDEQPDLMGIARSAISFVFDEIARGEASEVWTENDFEQAVSFNDDLSAYHLEEVSEGA
jgi:hypothetical protein